MKSRDKDGGSKGEGRQRGKKHSRVIGEKAVITSEVKVRPLCLALHLPAALQFIAHLNSVP